MIEYLQQLNDEEKEELTEVVQTLLNQTYLLERKYDKRFGRYQNSSLYRVCERHLDFLMEYFEIAGLQLIENRQYGIMSLKSNHLQGDKLSKMATLFVLLLKLIYDEKMNSVSNSIHVFATMEELYAKIQLFRLWDNRSLPITEVRKAVALLKKYQVIEVLDVAEELEADTRILIYPTVNLLISGMDMMEILEQYTVVDEEETEDGQISSFESDVP